jgi:predicted dehydrogenase
MEKIRMALVGCGGMGTRHLYGLSELAQTPFANIELAALCDVRRENAELAATETEKLLGFRPPIYTDLETMARQVPDLAAVDVVTDPSYHHSIACQALDLGLHVLVEKPMAISVRACRQMVDAAQRNGRVLSVAENYRRDPSARLVRHLLGEGKIGTPYLAWLHALSGGDHIFITPWRHLKERGGPIVDMGVHYTDLLRYQLGDVEEVYGAAWLVEKTRRKQASIGDRYAFYQQRHAAMETEVPATAEDSSVALLRMRNGVVVNWMMGVGGHGGCYGQAIVGDQGVIPTFGSRGAKAVLQLAGQAQLEHEQILQIVTGFELQPLEAHFFPERVFAGNIDWRLLAIELHELGECALTGRTPEVDGTEGLKDVAAVYAILESAAIGRAVRLSEVESGAVCQYQVQIDEALGIG